MDDKVKVKYLREKRSLLKDFGIKVTEDISEELESMYPDEVAIENYTRALIVKHLGD